MKLVAFFVTALATLCLASPLLAQEATANTFEVDGQVVNGTPGGGSGESLRVQVIAFADEGRLGSWEATTDQEGRFRVEDVPRAEGATYVVGTEYAGATYVDRLRPPDDQPVASIELPIYESVPLDPGIRFDRSAFIVSAVDGERQTITMLEVHSLYNPTEVTFLPRADGAGGPSGLLVFGLPQHAFNLAPHLGITGGAIVQIDRGFASLDPVRPGKTEIAFSYDFPFAESSYVFRRTLRYPVESLRVLAPVSGPELRTEEGEPAIGRVSLGDREYQELQLGGLAPGANLGVMLADLPARPAVNLPLAVTPEPVGAVGAIIGVLTVIAIWWRSRGLVSLVPTHDQILDALVALDLDHAAGKIQEADYVAERTRLLGLTQPPSA